MTTDPTAAHPPHTTAARPAARPAVPASAAPYGIAPVAVAVPVRPRRSRRRKLVDAAVVTSALATLPIAAAWNRAETTGSPTLVEAVSELDAAEDDRTFRATTAALKATSQRTAATPTVAPTVAGPAPVMLAATTPDALTREATSPTRPAPAPAPAATSEEDAAASLEDAAEQATATEPTPIARVAGIELVAPSAHTVLVGFHEAAGGGTLEMESLAPLAVALNGERTAVAPGASADQVAPVMELPTRDRGTASASAVDIAVPAWRDIVAPVSGTVTAVNPYTLYGEFPDNRVEIEPEGQPGVRVVMIHIGEVEVRPGDEVVAGETLVARTAKQFPFASQIDRFSEHASGMARPHVHMEVVRIG